MSCNDFQGEPEVTPYNYYVTSRLEFWETVKHVLDEFI